MNSVYSFELETAVLFGLNGIERYNSTVLVDLEDAHIIEGRQWHLQNGYCQSSLPDINHPNHNRKAYKLHVLVAGTPKGLITHHINHNRLDNRKCNLQIMTNMDHLALHRKERSMVKEQQATMQAARLAKIKERREGEV